MLCILMILSETRNNQSFTNHGHCQILFLFCFEFNLLIHVQCNCPEKAKHFLFLLNAYATRSKQYGFSIRDTQPGEAGGQTFQKLHNHKLLGITSP